MASDHDGNAEQCLAQKVARSLSAKGAEVFRKTYNGWRESDADQVVSLNKYFRGELAKAPVSTMDERSCLRDDLSPTAWLKYFGSHVAPTLSRFDLPSE